MVWRTIGILCIALALSWTCWFVLYYQPKPSQTRPVINPDGIPINPKARILADVHNQQNHFLHRILTETYLKREDRDRKHDEAMLAILSQVQQCMLTGNESLPMDELRHKAMLLMRAHCNDPLVSYVYGFTFDGGLSSMGDSANKRAIESMPTQGYSAYLGMRSCWLLDAAFRKENDITRRAYIRQGQKLLLQWIDADKQSCLTDGLEYLIQAIRHYLSPLRDTPDDFAAVDQFLDQLSQRNLPAWLIDYAYGTSALYRAWLIRGSGWVDNVRDDQWPRINEQLEIARIAMHKAYAASTDRDEPAEAMIQVSMMRSNEHFPQDTPLYWFEQAVNRRFDATDTYGSMALALLPRWSCQPQQVFMTFAQQCVDTQRFDTNVPYRAVMMAHWIAEDEELEGGLPQLKKLGGFELICQSLEGYISHETDADRKRAYASELLFWCFLLDEPRYARKVYQQLDNGFDRQVLSRFNRTLRAKSDFTPAQINQFLARGGSVGTLLDLAVALENKGQFDQAIKLYQQIKDQARDDEYVGRVADEQMVLLQWRKGFESGQWTPLTFNEALNGWKIWKGDWQRVNDHTVQGITDTQGLLLFLAFKPGKRFEIQGKIRFVKQVKPYFYNAGLMFINPHWDLRIQEGFLFVKDEGALKHFSSNLPVRVASIPIADELTFNFRFEDELAWVEMNGKSIYSGVWRSMNIDALQQAQWCIGGSYMRFAGTTLQFADLQMRKLEN